MRTFITINNRYRDIIGDYVRWLAQGNAPEGQMVHAGRNTIVRTQVNGMDVVVKCFGHITAANRFFYTRCVKSKAQRSFIHAMRLRYLDIDSPEPVACVDVRKGMFLHTSLYLCRFDDGQPMTGWHDRTDHKHMGGQLATFALQLHRRGVWHRDFNPGNILWHNDGHFSLIDVNRMRFGQYGERVLRQNCGQIHENDEGTMALASAYLDACEDPTLCDPRRALRWAHAFIRKRTAVKRLLRPFKAMTRLAHH